MADRVKLVTSTCGTAAFEAGVDAYRRALADGRGAESVLILPTHLLVARITEQLLSEQDNGVLLSPNILTFASLAERILTANAADARHIGIVARQELIRTVIAEQLDADRLEYFRPIASTPGFRRSTMGLIGELKRAEIFPQQLGDRIGDLGSDAPERQLADLYAAYQNHLQQRNLYDAEGRFWNAKRVLAEADSKGPVEPLDLLAVAGFTDFTGAQIDILRLLADRSGRTLLSLPLTEDAREEDLFDTTRLTFSRIETAMPGRLDRMAISAAHDLPVALARVYEARRAFPDTVIVGTGGVCDVGGLLEMLFAGADLVGVGFGVMADPELPQRLHVELGDWLDEHGFTELESIIGVAQRGGFNVH